MTPPACSVVVPSRNRRRELERLLDALDPQTDDRPAGPAEVIVVLDGSLDDSAVMLRERAARSPFPLRHLVQARRGAGAARNRGASEATGDVLLFLDDDVVPEPGLVARHLAAHASASAQGLVVIGDCPIARPPSNDRGAQASWAWWEEFNHRRADPGTPRSYRDFCAGNVSVSRRAFDRVGGFDARFSGYGNEDWELGHRLLGAGVEVVVDPAARAVHHQSHSTTDRLLHRRSEGRSDVLFGTLHPEIRAGLRVVRRAPDEVGHVARDCFFRPARARARLAVRVARLAAAERASAEEAWQRARLGAFDVCYWMGAADALGSWEALEAFHDSTPPPPVLDIEVAAGLPPAIDLPVEVPGTVRVSVGGTVVGEVRLQPFTPRTRAFLAERIVRQLRSPALGPLVDDPLARLSRC